MSGTYVSSALRRQVYERVGGACEYCQMPEAMAFSPHQIDHIIAQKHGGTTQADNLALACALCNKHKGSDIASIDPEIDEIIALYHPRKQRWVEHFQLNPSGNILPLTGIGRVTVSLLQLNRAERVAERQILMQAGLLSSPGLT